MLIFSAGQGEPVKQVWRSSLQRAVNCEHPQEREVRAGSVRCLSGRLQKAAAMNVVEIDAASNNGVDNIREISEEVAYSDRRKEDIRYISSMRCICFPPVHLTRC